MKRCRIGSLFVVALVACGCAQSTNPIEDEDQVAVRLDEEYVSTTDAAWIEQARQAHAFVDSALASGQVDDAAKRLRAFVQATAHVTRTSKHAQVLRRDLFTRLAQLELMEHNPSDAMKAAETGLAFAATPDAVTAQLHFWRARAHEALGDAKAAELDFERCRDAARTMRRAQ